MPVTGRSGKVYSDSVKDKSFSELLAMGYSYPEADEIKHALMRDTSIQKNQIGARNNRPVRGKSGRIYAAAVRGKTTSELFRMGYTSWEVDDIKRKKKHRANRHKAHNDGNGGSMKFHSVGHHKSGFFERLASMFSSIEFIAGFRRRHRAIFNVFLVAVVMLVLAGAAFLSWEFGLIPTKDVKINQPVRVNFDDEIEHTRTADGEFASKIYFSFETDFLIKNGIKKGEIVSIVIRIMCRNKEGEVYGFGAGDKIDVVTGDVAQLTTTLISPDGYIDIDDIVGVDMR